MTDTPKDRAALVKLIARAIMPPGSGTLSIAERVVANIESAGCFFGMVEPEEEIVSEVCRVFHTTRGEAIHIYKKIVVTQPFRKKDDEGE